MKIRGLTAPEVDAHVNAFSTLMQKGMRSVCASASKNVSLAHSPALVSAGGPGEEPIPQGALSEAIDGLSVMSTQWGEYTTGTLLPALEKIATSAASAVASPLGKMPAVKTTQFISSMSNAIAGFSDEMWQTAKTSLVSGAQDGESIQELANRVEQVAEVKAKKAHVIAQTTVIAAINGGEWQQMMEATAAFDVQGVKEWEATEDAHTRPTHAAADGQRVSIDSHFVVGDSFLLFPGDPEGAPGEIISCRCTTLYDLDVEDQITASQTSPETLSASPAVDTNGQFSLPEDGAVTAAVNAEFNAMHPRGKDGKFIKKGSGLPGHVFDTLTKVKAKQYEFSDLAAATKKDFVSDVTNIQPSQWSNLKDEDKKHITNLLEAAVDDGLPGSAKALQHVEGFADVNESDDGTDLFNPNNPLPPTPSVATPSPTLTTGSSEPIKITHGLIHAKHTPGTVIAKGNDGSTITWNGSEYELKDGETNSTQLVKKSKLYAKLNAGYYATVKWSKSGKQETEVSHTTPLDAAPTPAPIPHPVASPSTVSSFPASGTFDSQAAMQHVLDTGDALYSPNGKYRLTKKNFAGVGVVQLSKKQPDGTWSEPKALKNGDLPDAATWKKVPGSSSGGWPTTPGLVNDNTDPFDTGGTPDFLDTTGLSPAKLAEYDKLAQQYDEGLMTEEEWHQQINLLKSGPEPDTLVTPTLPTSEPDYTIAPGTKLLSEDIIDLHNGASVGDVLAVGETPGGTPYELTKLNDTQISAKNMENGVESFISLGQLQNITTTNKIEWAKPGSSGGATSSPAVTPGAKFEDLDYFQKSTFYTHFKNEKVSPAWSGAKIYKSLHAAKLKTAGDPKIAGLNDNEMLKIVDWGHWQSKAGMPKSAYSEKVKEWLKTPNGQKAFKELNPAIPTGSPSTSSSTSPSVWDTMYENMITNNPVNNPFASPVKKVAKKAAPSVPSPGSSNVLSVSEALGDPTVDALTDTTKLYQSFKTANYGKYLTDKPEHIYWNAVQQAKAAAHMTPGSVLAAIDEEGAKKFGVPNEKKFTAKVTKWLKTAEGKKTAAEIKAGTYSPGFANPASYGSSGYGDSTAYAHPASTPLDQKVANLNHTVPPYDPNVPSDHFKVISTHEAASMWSAMEAQHGAMTATQKAALKKYTGSAYHDMNGYLRGKQGATDAIAKAVKNAQDGMRPSTKPILIHRGNGWFTDGAGNQWNNFENIKKQEGSTFHQQAFFSTSVGGSAAFGGNIKFEIECPVGTPMAYVKAFSHYKGENEMLLAANLRYKVVSVNPTGSYGQVTVRLRVIAEQEEA